MPSLKTVEKAAVELGITFDKYSLKDLHRGTIIEGEHDLELLPTVRIAMNHLNEYPHYYKFLARMEKKMKSVATKSSSKKPENKYITFCNANRSKVKHLPFAQQSKELAALYKKSKGT
jgi:hypothetical protein